jgi:lipopolysaccharide biosynthesis protein
MRLIAFYLPQYHPIPENDLWWGKGFTEWTNVAKAKPLFRGHYQPHLPSDLGFYDLRVEETREQQAELARHYGIYGFCYYYYWFNGRRLLERPLKEVIRTKKPEFPFCVCWANEPWTRNWDGNSSEVLMPQLHTAESDENFIQELLPIFDDPRYIRINGRPLLLIYRTELLPDIARTAQTWREAARRRNIDLYLCRVESFTRAEPTGMHFDAACEFPPNALGLNAEAAPQLDFVMQDAQTFPGRIYDYERLVRLLAQRPDPGYKRFLGTTPSWDNTARSGVRGAVFINSSPDLFRHMLTSAVRKTKERFEGDEQIVFINAWNEWAEGAHLEPDKRYGHGFLEACLLALASARDKSKAATADAWETYVPYSVV